MSKVHLGEIHLSKMTMYRTIFRNIGALWISKGVNAALYLLLVMAISRRHGVVGLGQYVFAFSFASLVFLFFRFGLDDFMIRELSRSPNKILTSVGALLSLRFLSGLLAYIFLIALAVVLPLDDSTFPLILSAGVFFYINYFDSSFLIGFWSREEIHYDALISLVRDIIGVLLALIFVWADFGLVSVFLALAFGVITGLLVTVVLFVKKIGVPQISLNLPLWLSFIRHATPFLVNSVMIVALLQLDMVMVVALTDTYTAGIVAAAFTILKTLVLIVSVMAMAFYPRLSTLWTTNRIEFRSLSIRGFLFFSMVGVTFVASLWFISPSLLVTLFGAEFLPAVLILRYFSFGGFFLFILAYLFVVLNAANHPWHNTIAFVVGLTINFLLNVLLIPKNGALGVTYASIVSFGVTFAISLFFTLRLFKEHRFVGV